MGTILHDATLIDCTGSDPIEDAALFIDGNKIRDVGPREEVVRAAGNGHDVIELAGGTILPGLWDTHIHLGAVVPPWEHRFGNETEAEYAFRCVRKAQDNLNAGITSLRTMGDRFNADIKLKRAIEQGTVIGPRLYVSGDSKWSFQVAGEDAFRQQARAAIRAGADHVKIFATGGIAWPAETIAHTTCTPAELCAAVEEAHRWNKTASVHAIGDEGVIMAAETGIDSIEHGFVLSEAGVDAMKKHGNVFCPNLVVTAAWNEDFMREQDCFPEWLIVNAIEARQVHHVMFRKAVAAGIPIVAGVDNLPRIPLEVGIETFGDKPALMAEVHLMAENGLTPLQALMTATRNPARLCKLDKWLGTLEPGKLADVIAVPGDPLSDLNILDHVHLVIKDGRVIRHDDRITA